MISLEWISFRTCRAEHHSNISAVPPLPLSQSRSMTRTNQCTTLAYSSFTLRLTSHLPIPLLLLLLMSVSSAIAGGAASAVTNPLDLAKLRLQVRSTRISSRLIRNLTDVYEACYYCVRHSRNMAHSDGRS